MSENRKLLVGGALVSAAVITTIGSAAAMWGAWAALFAAGLCLWCIITLAVLV